MRFLFFCGKMDILNAKEANLMDKLVLIDGNSLLNRAFYATPVFTTKSGVPTNGIFGFIKLMLKIISDKKPSYLAVAFDLHAPTFRHKMYDGYKAGRKPMPEDLVIQIPLLKELLSVMNVKILEMEGYEADDIIGTVAKRFPVKTYIYTGDRDSYQLVDETTTVCYTKRGVSDLLELSENNFHDEIGLVPSQIIDLKALMGDKSDNIPGVVGVGEKSAMELLNEYFDLDGVYEHITEIKGALNKKLADNKETAYFSKQLATIDVNIPIDLKLEECVLRMPFSRSVREKFAEFEFKSLQTLSIFDESTTSAPTVSVLVEPAISTVEIENISSAIELLKKGNVDVISCYLSTEGLRFFFKEPQIDNYAINTLNEYRIQIKRSLLDVGVFEEELQPLLEEIFATRKTVILFNSKEIRHKIKEAGVNILAELEDVGMVKCLAEGLGNTDTLDFALGYHSLPLETKAYGIYRLFEIYYGRLTQQEKNLYRNVELPLSKILYDMESIGVNIDEEALKMFSLRYGTEIQKLKTEIYDLAGGEINLNSPQQLGILLFETLKIGERVKKAKTTKSYKTTAEELEKYADEHPIINKILRYRQLQKLLSTYVEGFKPLIIKGKVHTTYNQTLTSTGRLSSANPNLQNIPVKTEEGRELRKLFKASEGNVLLDADYSQIELRLLAHFSNCKELIEAYCKNLDIHAITAAQVFETPLEKVTPQMRRDAKAVNFGIIYGISAFGLSKDLGTTTKKAQAYIDRYFESYSSIKSYLQSNVDDAKEKGYTTTLLGRRRVINELKSSNYNLRAFGERAAMNMPLQGSSADIIKLAMIAVAKRLKDGGYNAKLVLQVHDELLIDCPKEEVEEVSKILKTEMENAISLKVPLTVEVGVGETWYLAK